MNALKTLMTLLERNKITQTADAILAANQNGCF